MPAAVVAALGGVGATIAAGTAVAGLGISAASAAGAFSSPVEKSVPTPAEMRAAKEARAVYNLGRDIQTPLDQLARKDLQYLGSNQALDQAGSMGVNELWRQMGPIGQQLGSTAAASGGPGSGRWWGQLGQGTSAIGAGVQQANLQGRIGGLNQYIARQGQFLDRRSKDLDAGLGAMTSGGTQAMQNQANRINTQVQNNIATSQAMSSLGGSLMGVGMGALSLGAGGGAGAGGFGGPYGPNK